MEKYPSIESGVWIIFACLMFLNDCSGSIGPEKRLINDLLKNYDPDERPAKNTSDIMNLDLVISYRQLQDLNEPSQVMTSLVWFTMKWKDAFLKWNSSDYEGHSTIYLDPSRVWKPDLTLYNNAHENGGDLYSFKNKVTVTSDGSVTWLAPTILKSVCIIDISKFPFDKQECTMKIGSWVYHGLALDINILDRGLSAPETNYFQKNSEWELETASAQKNTIKYACCSAPFYDVTYTFRLRRKPLYYIVIIVLPSVFLSLLASISFLFPADSGERVSLIISVFLGLFVIMLIVKDLVPVTSESYPIFTQCFIEIGLLIFMVLLATSFILRMNHAPPMRPVPRYLASIRNCLATVFCVEKRIFKKPVQLDLGETILTDSTHRLNLRDFAPLGPTRMRLTEEKILRELQKLSKRLEEDDLASEMKEDWQFTMRVFDKTFFWVFLLAFFSVFVYFVSHW